MHVLGAIARLYDIISCSSGTGPVPMGPYLEGLAESLRSSLLETGTEVRLEVSAEPLSIVEDHAVTLGLIVNELATNAIKPACPDGRGRILITFARDGVGAMLTVADDGDGMGTTKEGGTGKGSRFVKAFVSQVGGTLTNSIGPEGTTLTVRLPASVLANT